MAKTHVNFVGCASGLGAPKLGSGDGPKVFHESRVYSELGRHGIEAHWRGSVTANPVDSEEAVKGELLRVCTDLAEKIHYHVAKQSIFGVIGGDHACAMGTWSGAYEGLKQCLAKDNQPETPAMGLIWLDAHLDAHTPDTSESGKIHGMPLAHLLGHGDKSFREIASSDPKVLPHNVVVIGARSYESGEEHLLKQLKVRIYYMDEVKDRGFEAVFQDALAHVKKNTQGYGITLDLDMFDPEEVPGVGSPEAGGVPVSDALSAFKTCRQDPNLLGVEVVEFDPHLDKEEKTVKVLGQCCQAFFGND